MTEMTTPSDAPRDITICECDHMRQVARLPNTTEWHHIDGDTVGTVCTAGPYRVTATVRGVHDLASSVKEHRPTIGDPAAGTLGRLAAILAHTPASGSNEDDIAMADEIEMLAAYSAALDEVYALRRALALEASVVEANTLDLKALSKRRRTQLAQAVERMRGAARGEAAAVYAEVDHRSLDREMERAGGSNVLTRWSWEASLIGRSER